MEVAESSLAFDRAQKGSLYARGGVADYWIVNLVDRVLEISREPAPDAGAPFGWSYQAVTRVTAPASVSLLVLPAARIAVGDLLP